VVVTGADLLKLFGADVANAPAGAPTAFAVVHLVGLSLAVVALGAGAWQFVRGGDLVAGGLAAGIVISLAAYMLTGHGQHAGDVREMVAVLPLGAALAGRVLGPPPAPPPRAWAAALIPALSVTGAVYLAALGYAAAQPPYLAQAQTLASWLEARGMTGGLGGYWQSNIVTVDSGGRVTVNCAWGGKGGAFVPCGWETKASDYDPATRRATFYVMQGGGSAAAQRSADRAFGSPRQVYHVAGYTVLAWDTNLLDRLGK
jgi:hypothetical protein